MKFSVVIPCYNADGRIAATLDSIARQSYPAHEVIVIDDGSTDDSINLVKQHDLDVIQLTSNRKGPAGARNVGLAAATGDAIAFIDADDMWLPDHLETAHGMLASSDAVACASNCILLYESLGYAIDRENLYKIDSIRTDLDHNQFIDFFYETNHFCQPSVVVKQDQVGTGFDENLWGTEDIDFFLRTIFRNSWAYNPKPTVIYRQDTPSSVSKNVVRQTYNKLLAMKNAVDLGYDGPNMDVLIASAGRKAIANAITYAGPAEVQRAWSAGSNYLDSKDRLILSFAKFLPGVFGYLMQKKHERTRRAKNQHLQRTVVSDFSPSWLAMDNDKTA